MSLHSILAILDKPKSAQTAYERSLALQALTGAHVDLTAFCWQASCDDGVFSASQSHALQKEILRSRTQWQHNFINQSGDAERDISVQTVWARDIATWVAERVAATPVDLIVKSVHQSRSIRHMPLDWSLLRQLSVPLLLVSSMQRAKVGPVLATLDLRHNDAAHRHLNRQVIAAAAQFAALYKVPLRCVTVLEVSKVLMDMDLVDVPSARRKFISKIKPELQALLGGFDVDPKDVIVRTGKVGRVVNQQAARLKASLMVVGSQAHRAKQMVGLGNSAERIVAGSRCDVLAIHP